MPPKGVLHVFIEMITASDKKIGGGLGTRLEIAILLTEKDTYLVYAYLAGTVDANAA